MNAPYEIDAVPGYTVRRATVADAAVIAHHRVAMFRDMGVLAEPEAPALHAASGVYLTAALRSAEYLGWVIEVQGQVLAGGGMLIRPLLPRPGCTQGSKEVYVLNVYTEAAHRRRGLARQLMQVILDECVARGITRVSLHASDDGRPLYVAIGFLQTNEMRLELRPQPRAAHPVHDDSGARRFSSQATSQ
jgi:ribosomal protein S18 acetylase RimI-like enzyme